MAKFVILDHGSNFYGLFDLNFKIVYYIFILNEVVIFPLYLESLQVSVTVLERYN